MPRSRVFGVMQYAVNPETGEKLLTEDRIRHVLGTYKSIKRWAWIAHDHDLYDSEEDKAKHPEDATKPLHYHIAIDLGSTTKDTSDIARWFDVPENFVQAPKDEHGRIGKGRYLLKHLLEYLPHDKFPQRGKYDDSDVHANFDWRGYIAAHSTKKEKEIVAAWISSIMSGQATLKDCREDDSVLYVTHLRKFRDAQSEYIASLPMPTMRMNFLVTGESAMGKTTLAMALARSLCPECKSDDACYHFVGSKDVPFDDYAGQPVIIWDDARPLSLMDMLGGRDNLFRVFDPYPTRSMQNIKYGKVSIINKYNIFTTVLSYSEFLDGLAGQYKTKSGELIRSESRVQSYRRFPILFQIRLEDFSMLVNKGWHEGNTDFLHFAEVMRFVSGVWRLRSRYKAQQIPAEIYEPRAREKEAATLLPVIDEVKKLMPPEVDEDRDYTKDMEAIETEVIGDASWTYPAPDDSEKKEPVKITYDIKRLEAMRTDDLFFHHLLR